MIQQHKANSMRDVVEQVVTNPKVAAGVSTATAGSGLGMFLDAIPNDIGKLAALVGIVLSVVLILTHVAQFRKTRAETEILLRKEQERLEEIRKRRESGLPARRQEDGEA